MGQGLWGREEAKGTAREPGRQPKGQPGSSQRGQWDTYLFGGDVVEYSGKQYRRSSYVKAILCMEWTGREK